MQEAEENIKPRRRRQVGSILDIAIRNDNEFDLLSNYSNRSVDSVVTTLPRDKTKLISGSSTENLEAHASDSTTVILLDNDKLPVLVPHFNAHTSKTGGDSDTHGLPTLTRNVHGHAKVVGDETAMEICFQTLFPFMMAGLGMVAAGVLLDKVQVFYKFFHFCYAIAKNNIL